MNSFITFPFDASSMKDDKRLIYLDRSSERGGTCEGSEGTSMWGEHMMFKEYEWRKVRRAWGEGGEEGDAENVGR